MIYCLYLYRAAKHLLAEFRWVLLCNLLQIFLQVVIMLNFNAIPWMLHNSWYSWMPGNDTLISILHMYIDKPYQKRIKKNNSSLFVINSQLLIWRKTKIFCNIERHWQLSPFGTSTSRQKIVINLILIESINRWWPTTITLFIVKNICYEKNKHLIIISKLIIIFINKKFRRECGCSCNINRYYVLIMHVNFFILIYFYEFSQLLFYWCYKPSFQHIYRRSLYYFLRFQLA